MGAEQGVVLAASGEHSRRAGLAGVADPRVPVDGRGQPETARGRIRDRSRNRSRLRGPAGALAPLTEFLRAVPPIAIVPVAIVILGLGDGTRIAVIAFGVCFPVLVNTVEGVRAVSPETRDTATMLQVGPVERLYRIYLPAALPSIVAGLRIALSIGLVMLVISEFAAGSGNGLGGYIAFQQSQYNVPEMYGGILFLGLLGYLLNHLFVVVERRVLSWHPGATGELAR